MSRPVAAQALLVNQHYIKPSGGYLIASRPVGTSPIKGYIPSGQSTPTINWDSSRLFDAAGDVSIEWDTRTLRTNGGVFGTLDWGIGGLYDLNSTLSVAWAGRQLYDSGIVPAADWQTRILYDTAGIATVYWGSRYVTSSNGGTSIDWENRNLTNQFSATTLNWRNRQLSGNWQTDTVPTLGTHLINKNYLETGNFNLTNVVRTTGTQTVSGVKSFQNVIQSNSGIKALSSNGGRLLNTGDITTINWHTRDLYDNAGNPSLNWSTRTVYDPFTTPSLSWVDRVLNDGSANVSVRWNDRWLVDASAALAADWQNRQLINSIGFPTLDWGLGLTYDASLATSIDWSNRYLNDAGGNSSIDWGNKQLNDSVGLPSVAWDGRYLYNAFLSPSLNWQDNILLGTWTGTSHFFLVRNDEFGGFPTYNGAGQDGAWFYHHSQGAGTNYTRYLDIVSTSINTEAGFRWVSCNGAANSTYMTLVSGKLGIGIANPGARLSLGQATDNTKLALYDDGGGTLYGFGIQTDEFRFHLGGADINKFNFYRDAAGSNPLMTLLGGGNVGIGNSTPDQKLDVAGNISLGRRQQVSKERFVGLVDEGGVFSSTPSNGTAGMIIKQESNGDVGLSFKVGRWGVYEDIKMVVNSSGNVGISTTNPRTHLDVSGAIASRDVVIPTSVFNIDWSSGNYFQRTLAGNTTFTFSNTVNGQTINIITSSTGAYRVSFPTGIGAVPVKWGGGAVYSGTSGTAQGVEDIYTFMRVNDKIYANYSVNY